MLYLEQYVLFMSLVPTLHPLEICAKLFFIKHVYFLRYFKQHTFFVVFLLEVEKLIFPHDPINLSGKAVPHSIVFLH